LDIERSQILLKSIPRLVIEFVVIFLFSLGLLFIIFHGQEFNALIPVMAMIAVALFRLIPSLNRIYGCTSNIKYSESIFKKIHEKIVFLERGKSDKSQKLLSDIHVDNIQSNIIQYKNIALTNKSINIVYGRSGIGKTTFADIICGLIEIKDGLIQVNGRVVNSFNSLTVSYVTQKNYFISGSIKENITISNQLVSESHAKDLIRKVGLENQLRDRFGVEEILNCELSSIETDLSGGQYQKLAIVRGILRDADIYVFDEPTSALDIESKKQVMCAIEALAEEKMVVIISHDKEVINNDKYQLIDLERHVEFI
jgi:ABC-type transport system involved in cytochrome bd biosynthesis fused ATPase/permease subunit